MKSKKLIRQNFRDEVFKRDGHKCVFCDETTEVDAHHITNRNEMPNGGYVKENGITLCGYHHEAVEYAYFREPDDPFIGPEALYKIINSNKDLAVERSEKLLTVC